MSSSPLKTSPKKRRSPTKENQNPAGVDASFTSPTKKPAAKDMSEERRQRRHASDDTVDEKYMSAESSPTKSGRKKLPKSPVKRMRQLEKQAEQ